MAEAVRATDLAALSGTVDLLVQCTSQGMHGVPPSGLLVPVVVLEAVDARAVLDLVYSPGGTELVGHARALGLPTAGGERVLLHQAAAGFELWTGRKAPLGAMEAVLGATRGP
jgi:shikimate dehydrogenase